MINSTFKKYKNIESYYKEEFGVRMFSPRSVSLEKLEFAKEKLHLKNLSELRVLKSDANSLSDWIKTITILFTVLGLVFTMTTSVVTSTNQSYDALDNSMTDSVRDMSIEEIKVANDPIQKNKQIGLVYDEVEKIKRERITKTYKTIAMIYLECITFLLACLLYFISIAKKSFALSNIINETIEEKKDLLLLEKELKKEDKALTKEINAETVKEKLRIAKLRQERLDMKYKK